MEARKYNATACGPGCPDTLDTGMLWFTEAGASFRGNAAAFTLPMEGLRIDRAGATGDTIRITNPGYPEWFISTTDLSMLREPLLVSRADLKASVTSGRRRGCCCAGGCITLILLLVALVVGLVMSRDAIVASVADHFPQEWEKKIGDSLVAGVVPQETRLEDPALVAGLNAIADPVLLAIPKDEGFTSFTLYLSADPTPNAFAMPGGHIVVSAGLILLADNAEEVAGVLAHEAAHATLRHGLQSIISRAGTAALFSMVLGDVEGLSALLIEGGGYLLNQKYSRDFERQADQKALEYLKKANVNPTGLSTFFEKLKALEGAGQMPAILSTHPATDERIKALESKTEAVAPGNGWHRFAVDYPALQSAVKQRVETGR